MLNDIVSAVSDPKYEFVKDPEIKDRDGNGLPELMVKFNQSAVQSILEIGDEVEIIITGQLTDGRLFRGSDAIQVIRKGLLAQLLLLLASLPEILTQLLEL